MRVTLISPYEDIAYYGIRVLSAVLKAQGVEAQRILLPHDIPWNRGGFRLAYPRTVLDQLTEATQGSDLIGISLTSNYFVNAVQITQHLHCSIQAPIIWGGVLLRQ